MFIAYYSPLSVCAILFAVLLPRRAASFVPGVTTTRRPTNRHRHPTKNVKQPWNDVLCSWPLFASGIPSLYEEQERLLVGRGELESQLMADTHVPIEAVVVKGSGSGGGFGGGSSGNKKAQLKAQGKAFAKTLRKEGVVRIDNVLSGSLADELRTFVYDMRQSSEELVRNGEIQPIQHFADVLLKENRCDLTIPLGGGDSDDDDATTVVPRALQDILQNSPVAETIVSLLGKKAVLYELSCLMSDPGSQRQVVHPDTPYNENDEPVLYTCFVALQDIHPNMGPTTWLPKSHTMAIHEEFQDDQVPRAGGEDAESRKDKLLRSHPSVLGLLPKGSCGIFDSRLLHCGGANQSDQSRALFYFTFKNPKIGYPGNPGSIRQGLVGKYTIADLDKQLTLFGKGKPSELAK